MPMTVALYKKLEEVEPQLRGVLFAILEEIEQQREETVTKIEFNELTEIVRDLAEAQKQTEKRVTELAEAQKQTEKRVNELTEAQKHAETRLSRLEAAIGELTASVKDLVNEQVKTRTDVKDLVNEQAKTRTELTGLTTTVGFVLEDRAYYALPALLKRDFGLEVRGDLVRKYVRDKKGEQIEVNIIGEATRNGDQFVIVGESKSQLSKNKIEEFLRKKLKRLEGVFQGELFPIMITYMASQPEAVEFALQQGIKKVYYSYEFPP
jgi:chromosome segregation ATPase